MPEQTHVSVIADTPEAVEYLSGQLLPQAGYETSSITDTASAVVCDVLILDITHLRGNPFASLRTQRHLGNNAPALLLASRLTGEMAAELFELNIRDFLRKPVDEEILLERIDRLVEHVRETERQAQTQQRVEQLKASLARRLNEMKILSRVGQSITVLDDIDVILQRIAEAAAFLAHAESCGLFLLDQNNRLVLCAQEGLSEQQVAHLRQLLPQSDPAKVVKSGHPLAHNSETPLEGAFAAGFPVSAAVSVPIIEGGSVIGVLSVFNHTPRPFDAADQAVLANLADYTAMALDRTNLLSREDELLDEALKASRNVRLHAETLLSPIEGIESQTDTLLAGGFGELTEAQNSAVSRIGQAAARLKEVIDYIQQELAQFDRQSSSGA